MSKTKALDTLRTFPGAFPKVAVTPFEGRGDALRRRPMAARSYSAAMMLAAPRPAKNVEDKGSRHPAAPQTYPPTRSTQSMMSTVSSSTPKATNAARRSLAAFPRLSPLSRLFARHVAGSGQHAAPKRTFINHVPAGNATVHSPPTNRFNAS